jgi:UDP-N-acetylmuramoyl-L-alanyl-D-glutamate--2,6-diaminopimelate ligase
VPLAAAAFTNFSRDHLDYHETMDAYFEAKMRLFERLLPAGKPAVIWTDDPKSNEVIERAGQAGHHLMTVGREGETIKLIEQSPTALGQMLILEHGGKTHRLALPLIGAYQAANVLTAAGLVLATGGDWATTFSAMQRVAPVRGRLERAVISRGGVPVNIDYAHTPDALEAAIAALRPHVGNGARLITVFGAGGDRDQGKRPEMGAVATRLSDVVIVTDDNPRSEDPAIIRSAIMAAAPGATEVAGRREAIAEAIRIAREGDIVLVAGKGHETGQIIGDQVLPFDDALVARECAA